MVSLRAPLAGALAGLAFAAACAAGAPRADEPEALLDAWLRGQTNITSWSAEFTQTRTLKALAQPLVARGRVWFAAPNHFRWQLGDPMQTLAVRQPKELLILYPRLKRAEKFPLEGNAAGPWRDALSLFEAGFPRGRHELDSRFKILSVRRADAQCEVVLEPKAAGARRLMPEFRIVFRADDFSLRATELKFADGSLMRNDFTNAVLNPPVDADLFTPPVPADYSVADPVKGSAR